MLEQAVIVLDIGVQEEGGLHVHVGDVASERVCPAQNRAREEHILGAVVGVARRGRAAYFAVHEQGGYFEKQIPVAGVAGGVEHLVGPYYAGVVGSAVGIGEPGAGAGQVRLDQLGYAAGVCGARSAQGAESQPAAERDALGVYDRIEGVSVVGDQSFGDGGGGSASAGV